MAVTDGGLVSCTRRSSRMAAVWIVAAASCHYFGYEFVRAASTTQFTEHFGSKMLPVGISMVPVLAVGLLTLYRYLLIQYGPYTTLVCSTLLCATGLCVAVVGGTSGVHWIEQGSVWFVFVFREAYISWLQSQYWSRLTSCLPQKDAKTVFGPILGVASVFATLGGLCVAPVVRHYGDFAGVALCSACLLVSLIFVRLSFEAGDQQQRLHGHGHGHGHSAAHKGAQGASGDSGGDSPDPLSSPRRVPVTRTARERALSGASGHGLSDKALDEIDEAAADPEASTRAESPLLRHPPPVAKSAAARCWSAVRSCEHGDAFGLSSLKASPILPWLFTCTMSMQVLATCITLCFQNYLVVAYAGDAAERSAFTGSFFALAKGISAALQFLGVPLLFRQVPLPSILALMPSVVLMGVAVLVYAPSLLTASGLLLVFKITEYSMFSAAREMLYMPLSFEARYMAKEVVDVFGYRLGKGGTALCVAFVLPLATPTPFAFTVMAVLAAGGWCWSVLRLRRAVIDDGLASAGSPHRAAPGRSALAV